MEQSEQATTPTVASKRTSIAFLLPTYKSPTMTAELLYAAYSSQMYVDCAFILLLDLSDTCLLAYKECVENLRGQGMNVGYIASDGAPYAGMVNRVAHLIDSDTICVIDSQHLPMPNKGTMGERIRVWLAGSAETMRVGQFAEDGCFPVVTQKMIERLGYVFHPLCQGRDEAELWLLSLADNIGVASVIPDCRIMESKADGIEILGCADEDMTEWTGAVLDQILSEECARLRNYIIQ